MRVLCVHPVAPDCLIPSAAYAKSTPLQQRIEAQRKKAEALQAQLHAKKAQLNAVTVKVQGLQAQLSETTSAIGSVSAHLDDLNAQERSTQNRANWNSVQLQAAERSLHTHDDALRKRLVEIYENGDLSYAEVLLSARTFTEFVERWEDLRLIINANEKAVRERRAAAEHVADVQAALDQTRLQLAGEQQDQQRMKNQLDTLAQERRNLVAVADDQRRHVATEVAEIEELSASEEAQLEALIRSSANSRPRTRRMGLRATTCLRRPVRLGGRCRARSPRPSAGAPVRLAARRNFIRGSTLRRRWARRSPRRPAGRC